MARTARFKVIGTDRGWRVNVPANLSETGKRQQRYFPTRDKASEFATSLRQSSHDYGASSKLLSPADTSDAQQALAMLGGKASLREVVAYYLAANDKRTKAPTLGKAWDDYHAARNHDRPRTLRMRNYWRNRLGDLADCKVTDIESSQVAKLLDGITKGETHWNQGLRVIRAIFNDCLRQGFIERNPCSAIKAKNKTVEAIVILSIEETKEIMRHAVKLNCSAPFAIAAFGGVRMAEIGRLTWDDVNLETGFIRIGHSKSKTRNLRNVRINPTLRAWLESIPQDKRQGRIVNGAWIAKGTAVRAGAGIDGTEKQNALRHSFATYLYAMEANEKALLDDMGHSAKVHFKHYQGHFTKTQAEPYWAIIPDSLNE
jgi:integrase